MTISSVPATIGADASEKESSNLWVSILSEVQKERQSQLSASKSILIVGDKECGKTTLIAKLQGNDDPKKGSALEYSYINVRDEYSDDQTKLGVWTLDGDVGYAPVLLEFALHEENISDTTCVIAVSMDKPWVMIDSLHAWTSVLQDHIDSLKLSPDQIQQFRNESILRWKRYVQEELSFVASGTGDSGVESLQSSVIQTPRSSAKNRAFMRPVPSENGMEDDQENNNAMMEGHGGLKLSDNILNRNLGLDIIVVVTKTDLISELEKSEGYTDEHFDFLQMNLRKFCMKFGAALIYTSVKEDKNCDLLYKYIVHKVYDMPLKTPALVVEKDAVFIPAGWENEKKIGILEEGFHSLNGDEYFSDVIRKPTHLIIKTSDKHHRTSSIPAMDVQIEDGQSFLQRHFNVLNNPNNMVKKNSASSAVSMSNSSSHSHTSSSNTSSMPPINPSPKKDPLKGGMLPSSGGQIGSTSVNPNPGGPSGGPASEVFLHNFFYSLLSKKSGVPSNQQQQPASLNKQLSSDSHQSASSGNESSTTTSTATVSLDPNEAASQIIRNSKS